MIKTTSGTLSILLLLAIPLTSFASLFLLVRMYTYILGTFTRLYFAQADQYLVDSY